MKPEEMSKFDIALNDWGIWKIIPGLFFTHLLFQLIFRKTQ